MTTVLVVLAALLALVAALGLLRGGIGRLRLSRRACLLPAAAAAVLCLLAFTVAAPSRRPALPQPLGQALVGRQADGSIVTSSNQRLTPAGRQVSFPGRPTTVAVRPDGRTAVALNSVGPLLVVVDLAGGTVRQRYDVSHGGSFAGLVYDPDGRHLSVSRSNGSILRLRVAADGTLSRPRTLKLPKGAGNPNPGGLAVSADGSTLYVVLNRLNTLGVLDVASGELTAQVPVGNAPHDVVVRGDRAYVSDQGGRRRQPGDVVARSSGTAIVADPATGGPSTGSVSVVDLTARTSTSIAVGLQPSGEHLSGHYLFVANSSSDTVSVIDTDKGAVTRTVQVALAPGTPSGSQPNAVTTDDRGHLIVSLGRANALAVYDWHAGRAPATLLGLIPTGWYPGSVAPAAHLHLLVVANDKGIGALGPTRAHGGHTVRADVGSLSLIQVPQDRQALREGTARVLADTGLTAPPSGKAGDGPIPVTAGERSPIRHVFYIIKENRTYDQVLGDVARGNGDPKLTSFGKQVTPNQHALVERFPLLDNFYASGEVSADGHQWDVQATVPDYLEKAFGPRVRSYPFAGGDALAVTRSGFLWGNALAHNRTVADFGEYAQTFDGPKSRFGTWTDWYHDFQKLTGSRPGPTHVQHDTFQTHSSVPQLDRLLVRDYPNFDLSVPDQYRELVFQRRFASWVGRHDLPDLVLLHLPDDHTAAAAAGHPVPSAMIADNDLALGKLVDLISHSPYWKDSAIFVTEDDAQAGLDHVDGHRTIGQVISPWTTTGQVSHRYYTQTNMVRTIEAILGLPAMNQMDAAALPMSELFTATPNLAPYVARPSTVPLDRMNPTTGDGSHPTGPLTDPVPAPSAAALPGTPGGLQRLWMAAGARMGFDSHGGTPDQVDGKLLDHAIWYATEGYNRVYPGDSAVLTPAQVRATTAVRAGPPAGD